MSNTITSEFAFHNTHPKDLFPIFDNFNIVFFKFLDISDQGALVFQLTFSSKIDFQNFNNFLKGDNSNY
jgi:hypothetical protein